MERRRGLHGNRVVRGRREGVRTIAGADRNRFRDADPNSAPELLTQNSYFEDGLDDWTYNQYVTLCDASDPDAPCVRLRMFGEIRQAFQSPD